MTETPRFVNGRAVRRGPSTRTASAAWFLPLGALGLGLAQLACSKSEPQPATPQTEPNAVATATASSLTPGNGAPDLGETPVTSPASSGIAPTATTSSSAVPAPSGRWPSALAAPTAAAAAAPNVPHDTTPNPNAITALASNRESSQITGCLAAAPSEQAPSRAASKSSGGGETWRATALGNGVLVTHTLEHACCLEGSAKATVSGNTITVEEQLTGQPCRCLCESTIQTRVSAPPGEYDVQSVTVTNGHRRVVQTAHVRVGLAPR